jgi:DNA-binding transcriptional regulator YdaS (Cro superfamily)
MDTQLFEELLSGAGTNQAGLASKIGVTRQMLHKYKSAGIPANRVIQFEKATGVPRERIRPDVFDEQYILGS